MAMLVVFAVATAIELAFTIYRALNQPSIKPPKPIENQLSTSVNGAPIAFGYGTGRYAGQIIFSSGIKYTTQTQSSKGGPSITSYTYYASFAVAFAEGPAKLSRIWFDSKVVYDPNPDAAGNYPVADYPAWDPTQTYNVNNTVSYAGQVWKAIDINLNAAPASSPGYWEVLSDYPNWNSSDTYDAGATVTYAGQVWVALASSTGVTPGTNEDDWQTLARAYPVPRFYPGDETQMPDPFIQAKEGIANTPAFRGLCYVMYENFPLANFGNRIPNVRGELTFGDANGPIVSEQAHAGFLEPVNNLTLTLNKPILAGDFLIAQAKWRPVGTPSTPTISDDAPSGGNSWTLLVAGFNQAIWYCDNAKACDRLNVTLHYTGSYFSYDSDGYVMKVTGQSSYTVASADDYSSPPYTDPMTVTNGPYSVTMRFQTPNATGVGWIAGLFVLSDAYGHSLRLALFISGDGFQRTSGGAVLIPDGWANEFVGTGLDQTIVLYAGLPAARVGEVVQNLCQRAGMEVNDVDVSLLTSSYLFPSDIIDGYAVRNARSSAELIKVLMQAYFFSACESDGVVKFVPRGLPSVMTIPEEDLGLLADMAKIKPEQISQEQDLPFKVTVTYEDRRLDYQTGKQEKARSVRIVSTRNQTSIDFPLTMTEGFARQIAEKALYLIWLERDTYATNLWMSKYMVLDATDVIDFVYQGMTFEMRVVENSLGQGLVVALNGAGEGAQTYLSDAVGGLDAAFVPRRVKLLAFTTLWLFDLPLLRDSDSNPGGTGKYFAMSSTVDGWPGGVLFKSNDDASFAPEATDKNPVNFGVAVNSLGPPRSPWTWDDDNTLTVRMTKGALAGSTDLNVLNGANALVTGSGEVIQFVNSVEIAPNTFTISRLLRGRRGTEWAIPLHLAGETIIDPYTGLQHVGDPLGDIGQLRYYRGATIGQDPATATPSKQLTLQGNDLKPYAPTSLAAARDGSGNATLTWIRRTRIGGDWLNGNGDVPLSEESELYDVDIMSGAIVVRTIPGLTSPVASYSAVDQAADFGSTQSSIAIQVYQKSASVGRGFRAAASV